LSSSLIPFGYIVAYDELHGNDAATERSLHSRSRLTGLHPARAQADTSAPSSAPVLTVEVSGKPALSLTAADLDAMPRATAALTADGNTTTYEGVLLYDLLIKAGWQFGRGMTGKGMASYILITAKDGYQVLFAPAEIDPAFAGEKVIVADKTDGGSLPGPQQPFRIVTPADKMHARSIYSIVKIELVKLRQ
jgi:hypothetical protein